MVSFRVRTLSRFGLLIHVLPFYPMGYFALRVVADLFMAGVGAEEEMVG